MNAMDLMTGLNNVRDRFVVSAGEFRQGERQVRALPKRKLWLISVTVCDPKRIREFALSSSPAAMAVAPARFATVFTLPEKD